MAKEAKGNLDQLSIFYDRPIDVHRILKDNIHHALSEKVVDN